MKVSDRPGDEPHLRSASLVPGRPRSRNSPYRDYYVWSDTDQKYPDARIIFLDTEKSNWTWDEQAGQYFWHRFYSSQPDLNFDNPAVRQAMLNALKFWLDLGIDGFRADAVPYLFEREGTNCENLPETHAYLKELRQYMDEHYPGTILLGEANQWPEDVRPYFGDGDEFHMGFHFPVMPRIYMALRKQSKDDLVWIFEPHPANPGKLPVVHLPAQSRRADAGDGDPGRAPVDVAGIRPGAAHAPQPGHPPPPCAPAG